MVSLFPSVLLALAFLFSEVSQLLPPASVASLLFQLLSTASAVALSSLPPYQLLSVVPVSCLAISSSS